MIKKCVFPAAGYGTRFLPATKSVPKEMLPVVAKPLIHYGIEEALSAGMTEMAMVIGRGKDAIISYLDHNYELEHQIKGTKKESLLKEANEIIEKATILYTKQKEMKGLGHAVLTAYPMVGNNPFGVILADDLCDNENGDSIMAQMVKLYKRYQAPIIAVQEVPKEEVNKYGVVAGKFVEDDILIVNDMVEKPEPNEAPSNLAVIGRYILTPDIFDILKTTKPGKGGEIQLTDAILELAKTRAVLAYKFKGTRFDCGSIDGFVEATNHFYNKKKAPKKTDKKSK